MKKDEAQKLLTNPLDKVSYDLDSGCLYVEFGYEAQWGLSKQKAVGLALFVTPNMKYRIGRATSAGTQDLLSLADAYARAIAFIKEAKLQAVGGVR